MKKIASAAALTLILSGCALPVPVQVASWVVDGIIYLNTDKSMTDHGISMVSGKDCALFRGLKGDEVCVQSPDELEGIAVAMADFGADLPDFAAVDSDTQEMASFETAAGGDTKTQPSALLLIEQWDSEFAATLEFSFVTPRLEDVTQSAELMIDQPKLEVSEAVDVLKTEIEEVSYSWELVDATTGITYN
ncbi:MAG: hypothetical protein OQJ97_18430 [Rhodospirillales bacterium]|nr:hypothetical protein [Rhodospirillales bacterium]